MALIPSLLFVVSGCGVDSDELEQEPTFRTVSEGHPLEPNPLVERARITVTSALRGEIFTPLFLAEYVGEFERENLEIEFVTLPASEAIPAVAQGASDVAATGLTVPFFNAVAEGGRIRLVAPGATDSPHDGLWALPRVVEGGPASLKGGKIGVSAGEGSPSMVAISRYLREGEISLTDVSIERIPIGDLAFALSEGIVDAAWLHSPEHTGIRLDLGAQRVAKYGVGQSHTGYVFGPNLLDERPEVGEAFLRALQRTTELYLQGDYKSDAEIIFLLRGALEMTEEELRVTGNLRFPASIDHSLFLDAQETWASIGGLLTYEEFLSPDQYSRTELFQKANGDEWGNE